MRIEEIDGNPILRKSIDLSLAIIDFCEVLNVQKKYVLSNQLQRAAFSIGANAMEAQNAESKADFIHKMKIAAKEASETQYWLIICDRSDKYPACNVLLQSLEEINRILTKIISSSKSR